MCMYITVWNASGAPLSHANGIMCPHIWTQPTTPHADCPLSTFPTPHGSVGLPPLLTQGQVKYWKWLLTSLTPSMTLNCAQMLCLVLPTCQKARSELQGLKDSPVGPRLLKAIARLCHIATSFKGAPESPCHGMSQAEKYVEAKQKLRDGRSSLHVWVHVPYTLK